MTEPTGDSAPLPAEVASLARERELGAVLGWQNEWANGENTALLVIGLVLMPLAFWWGPRAFGAILDGRVGITLGGYVVFPKIVGAVPLLVMLLPVAAVGMGLRRLFLGTRTTGGFTHGLLQADRRATVVIRWSEVDRMLIWSTRGGKPTDYAIVATDGRKIKFRHGPPQKPYEVTLGEQITSAVRHLGLPIQAAGPRD
jgi:hypothetical protein